MPKVRSRSILTTAQIKSAFLVEYKNNHCRRYLAAEHVSVPYSSIEEWRKSDRQFALDMEEAELRNMERVEGRLYDLSQNARGANSNVVANIFLLKNKHPDYKQNPETPQNITMWFSKSPILEAQASGTLAERANDSTISKKTSVAQYTYDDTSDKASERLMLDNGE